MTESKEELKPWREITEDSYLNTIDIRDVLNAINHEDPMRAHLLIAGFKKLQNEIDRLTARIKELEGALVRVLNP